MSAVERPLVMGVAGGSGAGKSTVVRKVIAGMEGTSEHVGALVRGETVEVPEYDFGPTAEPAAPGARSRPWWPG